MGRVLIRRHVSAASGHAFERAPDSRKHDDFSLPSDRRFAAASRVGTPEAVTVLRHGSLD
jgi:hypothetical protein